MTSEEASGFSSCHFASKSRSELGFPGGSDCEKSDCMQEDSRVWYPGSRRSPVRGNGKPLQYSGLENPMDRGAWQATDHGVAELDTTARLSMNTHTGLLALIQKMFPNLNSKISITCVFFFFYL